MLSKIEYAALNSLSDGNGRSSLAVCKKVAVSMAMVRVVLDRLENLRLVESILVGEAPMPSRLYWITDGGKKQLKERKEEPSE